MLEEYYKKEENNMLFSLYDLLCKNAHKKATYLSICKWFNEENSSANRKRSNKAQEKIVSQDVAHYCKKLEKCGFVTITS